MTRSDRNRDNGWFDVLSVLLFSVLFVLVLVTFQDYGITWDESSHLQYGDYILSFYSAVFHGEPPPYKHRWINYPYGGGFDVLSAVTRRLSPLEEHDTLHLLGGLIGLLGLLGTWQLGRLLGGAPAAFWSALILAMTPAYYGHMFNNPKDPPFAVGYVWALFSICAVIQALPAVPNRRWLLLTLSFGAAMFVRPVGAVVVLYLGTALASYSIFQAALQRTPALASRCFGRLAAKLLAAAFGGWVILVLFYPAAILRPVERPVEAIEQLSYFRNFVAVMKFGSETIWSYDVPWDYVLRYLVLKVPEMQLAMVGVGAGLGVKWLVQRRLRASWPGGHGIRRVLVHATLGLAIVFPPAYAMISGAALYDGLRHFLFLLPPLAVVAGLAVAALGRRLGRRARGVAVVLAGLASLDIIATMWTLHPHQYVYFNRFAGGLPGAVERYESDYYGNSHREAFRGLAETLWTSEPETFLNTVYVIDGCLSRYASRHYLLPNMRFVKISPDDRLPLEPAHFYLADRRLFCTRFDSDEPVVYRVRRLGVTLSLFHDLRLNVHQQTGYRLR